MFAIERRRSHQRHLVSLALILLSAMLSQIGYPQAARMEVLSLQSSTLTDQEFLVGRREGQPVTLAGELRLPRAGTDRLPVVILLHGSGGISSYVTDWEHDLLAMGVATFVIDSFSGRGLSSVNNDQSLLGRLAQTEDAYRAFELLEKHPRIDPTRIVLMGFSRGGTSTLYAALRRFRGMHGPASGREFAGYLAFYPGCNVAYRDDEDITTHPVRIFHGEADNYVPIAPCRAYVERLAGKPGANVKLTAYPDALHVFDWQAVKAPTTLPQAQTTRNCRLAEADNGVIINVKTAQPFSYSDACVERGPSIGYNEKASTEAREAVRQFIAALLKAQ
ncbi:dienelactone hydrolase family protein [Paraburkholderia mimosarum]|uniref:dienelactone hydrolase family protein n=1 Tax=Paraburkholderia mimosarum TaxID=312026 RepID=UPI000489535B|nr:dienelactone hydrolase family protein [Paraburkholderia mimosarum]